jgi:hypothetical protein
MNESFFNQVAYKSGECGDIQKNQQEHRIDHNYQKNNTIIQVVGIDAKVLKVDGDIK